MIVEVDGTYTCANRASGCRWRPAQRPEQPGVAAAFLAVSTRRSSLHGRDVKLTDGQNRRELARYALSMEINHSAPAIATCETFIEAAPEVVFGVIAVIDDWPS